MDHLTNTKKVDYKSGQICERIQMYVGYYTGNFSQPVRHSPYKLLALFNNILRFLEKQSTVSEAGTSREVIVLLKYFYYLVSKIKGKATCITQAFPLGPKNHGKEVDIYIYKCFGRINISELNDCIHSL